MSGKTKFILSVDDGCKSDLRVAEMSGRYNLETVFYIPIEWRSLAYDKGYEPLTYMDALAISKDFELGAHTITHRHLTKITYEEAKVEVVESKFMLERLFNIKVTKFCPPRGYTNDDLTKRTLEVFDSQRLTRGEGLVHIHPNSGANNNMPWREYAKTIEVKELWGHSWEFDKFDLWDELEEYIRENYAA